MISDSDSGEYFSLSFTAITDDKDTNWKENSEDAAEKNVSQKQNEQQQKRGGMMGDNGETELYKHEGGKRKKISCREEWYQKQWKTEKRQKHVKKDGEAIKSGVNKS